MLPDLCPQQQIIIHHFFDPLMGDKNLIIQAKVVRALFVLQILDTIQALKMNKKQFLLCKKLFGRINHHQLLNEYLLHQHC